jgi:hypothetical protein
MACTPGVCPCWPQVEPFDAAEMALLAAVQELMQNHIPGLSSDLWARIVKRTLKVVPRRRGYVLSTMITHKYAVFRKPTLLAWAVRECNRPKVQWLLDCGVCPNVGTVFRSQVHYWCAGPKHPGRPDQAFCISPFRELYSPVNSRKNGMDLLLSAGAYPDVDPCRVGKKTVATLQRQWRAWHGRTSRRLWAAPRPPCSC